MDFGKIIQQALSTVRGIIPSATYSSASMGQSPKSNPQAMQLTMNAPTWGKATPVSNQASPVVQPTATPVAQAMQLPQNNDYSPEAIKQGISKLYGQDNPILQNIPMLLQAGQQINQQAPKVDPLLPIILALRETQGGRDLMTPEKKGNKGDNNIYDLRGIQNGQTQFINYPDLHTATFGGDNGGVQAQGLTGLIGQNPIYADYRKSGDVRDLFSHYSPPTDSNGDLPTQANNYQWIRSHILGQ